MSKPKIMHMLTPHDRVSPFDVNMAGDAGYDIVVPYTGVTAGDVTALVQDAIFSRPPKRYNETGMFIGGFDLNEAADMFDNAGKAMVPPFELSVLVDPNGAYTTSAALVALVEHHAKERTGSGLAGKQVKIFGGGPVGLCAAVLAAQAGATATLVRLTDRKPDDTVERFTARYDVTVGSAPGQDDDAKVEALADADVVIATAKAGIRVLTAELLAKAPKLAVAADVNAVPPSGVEGVEVMDNGKEVGNGDGAFAAIGALAIGKIKYDVQQGLLGRMQTSDKSVCLDFPDAYEMARQHV